MANGALAPGRGTSMHAGWGRGFQSWPMGRQLWVAGTRCTRGGNGVSRLANEEPVPGCGAGPNLEAGVPLSGGARPHFHLLCSRLPSAPGPAGPNGRARTCESPGTGLRGAARRRRRLRAHQRRTVDKAATGKGDPHGRCSHSTHAGIGGLSLGGDLSTGTLEVQGP